MTTLEPLTEAELNALQAQWMNGNRERRQYRAADNSIDSKHSSFGACSHGTSLSEDCRRCAGESELVACRQYEPDPLAEDWTAQPPIPEGWLRHTVDITRQPMSVEDEPIEYVSPWKWLAALGIVAVFYVAVWSLVVWVARR